MVLDEILIDRNGVAAFCDFRFDPLGVNTDTAAARSRGRFGGGCDVARGDEVGGHFVEGVRFCRRRPGPQETSLLADPPDRFVPVTSLAAHASDAPAQPQEPKDRFTFGCAQRVHGGAFAPPPRACPRRSDQASSLESPQTKHAILEVPTD